VSLARVDATTKPEGPMPVTPTPPNRSRRSAPTPPSAPGPLIALVVFTVAIFVVAAVATGEYFFLLLGLVALGAALVPLLTRRR
jgi:hypothetical protein